MPTAEPLARTCSGRISGTYTHGMQFIVAPNESMYCLCMSVGVSAASTEAMRFGVWQTNVQVVRSVFDEQGRLTVKKNATLALLVALATGSSCPRIWNESRIEIISMLKPQPNEPHIIGLRRPVLSSVNVGYSEPKKNIMLMTPPRSRERLRSRPTLSCRTDVM